ncbi:uncharacterized protein LOC133726613 isoform X2 [Rosa rugosa]|uniref:uncharacterized protein LOC133726613 isoform X2 n=1 Tax=Rosa rugosa TaxID=74645 RepID=UPI002B40753F|nr:uncharacterized protein LOC133726613 isoform X2 [Rosa rugosa]
MATEADVPEAICIEKGEGVDRSLAIEQLDKTVDQCFPVELNKSKGDLDQHPEIHTDKPFADGENVQVEYSMKVESKNNSFGISEGEHFLDPLSEISQADQSNQAGMEIPKNEAQLQKGTQVGGGVEETGTEENEVIEERKEKLEQDVEKHDIVNAAGIISVMAKTGDANLEVEEVEASTNETTVDQHVQVISNQQDSIKEDVQCLEKEAESSEVDTKGAEKASGNGESYSKEASDLLEATTFQEYEASTSTLDLTNSSLKKDMELETNVHNSSDTNPILQEEFEEGTSTKVTSNDEEDSQQTLQNYELKEELQKLPEVTPEDAKTESAMENAEVISCTEQERTMQSTPEYSEKEEANPVHCPKENATMTEEVFEAASTEQETAEHALPEIHTAENHPQEFNEEKSRDYQASVEAAYLSTDTDEKNLEEQAIQEKSSSLVEEETTQQISREEEVHATNSKEEEKEADTKCEEPIEVADATREIEFETIEQRTETNKDLNVPIPEEEAYAEESTKAFVQNNSFLSEVSEVKTKEIIQEDHPTVGDYGLVSGEVSQVSASKEAEAENEEHVNNTPEEKGLQTILTDETVVETEDHAQAGENLTSKEKIEKEIQTAEGEGERDLKEIEEENKEPVDNAGIAPEEGLATILTDQSALQIEDIELHAEENVNSKDKSEEQIPTVADEGGNGLIEAQTENNEQVTDTDIASEEKGLETILTDEMALDIKDIDVQAEKDFRSKESSEKQVPVVADEGDTCLKEAEEEKEQETLPTILKGEPPLDIEVIDVQAEESFSPQEKLEELIPAVADEGDTGLKEAEEENKEQVKITDSAPEVKVTIGERALDNEDIELQVEEIVSSKDNLEKQIPTTALEGDTGLKEPEEENKEQVKSIDISTEEKGLATILTDETTHNAEDTDVEGGEYIKSKDIEGESCSTEPQEENKEEKVTYTGITPEGTILNSQEKLEEQVPVVADEGDTGLNEAEEENKEQIKGKDTSPEEKGLPIISTDDTALDSVKIELQSEENVSSTDNLEKQIPTEEAERGLTETEAENKEQATITDITPEVKSVPTTLTDQTALDSEKIELHAEENVNSTDYLEKQIPTAADEGEDILTEAEAESKEQVTINDITPEEKGVVTILTDERSLEIEDIDVQAEESSNSKENLEEEISAASVLGDTCVKEDEEESTEQVKSSNSSHEGKGLATILTEETTQDIEYTDVKAGADFNSGDILEKQIPTAVYEGETDSKEVEAENKEQVETTEIAPEEKGLATILIDETAEGIEVIDVQAGEINSKEVLEKQIPTAVDEGETDLKEAEADIKEQVETTDIVPEQKGVETILSDERALDLEDVHVQEQENFNSNENLESQIPTTVGEGETDLNEGEAEIKEQVKCTETAVEEKDVTTILRDETVVEVQDVDIKAEEKPIEAGEGEKVGILDDIPVNVYNTELVEEVTVEQSYQVPSHEEAEPKIAVEDEKSEDHPERNHMIVEEVIDEPKITSRDFSEEQIIEGNVVSSTPESIEEDTVKSSQDNEKETIELKEEGSCTENAKDENASDLTREYIPEDAPKQIKDEQYNAVKSENEILEDSQTIEVDERTTCETKNIEKSEEIPSTLPVKYEEVQQGEGSCTESTKEENANDHTREYVPEDATERIKDEDCNTVESKNEVLEDSQTVEVDESTTCETKNLETTEEIPSTLPVKYDEVQQGEGSYTESTKEENASHLTREYVPEDATEQIKDEDCNAVKSENEILEDESTTCETKNLERSEEILSTLPVKYDEVQQGEGSSPAPTEPLKEEDTLSVQVAKDDDGDNGAVNITETGAKVPPNDEEDSPEVLQKYEPEEEITELPHVKPEETTPESSSENAEVITCRKEEIQESLDKEKDTKESDTSSGEVLETTITEALPEIHTVEDPAERATEYQACIEAAELSTEGEKENSEEQTTREVSSSLIVETSEESSKEEEEKNEGQVECKDSIEEVKSETLEDTTEPKPISEEESNKSLVQDNSFSLEASEKEIEKEIQGEYSSTVRSFDSKVVSNETGLTEATTEDKEQVKTTHISSEEKDNEGTDVHNTELVRETLVEPSFQVQTLEDEAAPKLEVEDETNKSDDLPEKNNKICEEEVHDGPKITDRDFNEEQITEANVANLTTEPVQEQETGKDYQAEERETERSYEEGSSIENIKEGNASDISTECVPEDIDEKLKECIEEAVESKEQIIEGKAASFTPESIEDDTVKNSQDSEKETIELKEEESCTESIKEENASELSPEYIQEDGSKNFKDDKEDALKSEEEILEDSQTLGVVESTTCETVNVERSEDIFIALPAKYDEGSSPAPTEASKQENIDEDTSSVQETKDKDGEVTVTETSAEAPSNDEDDSPQVLQKYEPEEELTILQDAQPEEMKPEPSSEIEEVITCTKEETQESLDKENDTKESDASTGEACIEAAELSTEGEKEEQTTQEVSSSPIGEETTDESSKEEEKKEAHEECKEAIEGESSFSSKASEKEIKKEIQGEYSSTVRSFDSEVVSDERGLTEATEQVETTHIAPEEKDIGGKDVYNTELVGETVEPSSQVQTLEEEVETKLEVEDETDKSDDHPEKGDKICEEVLDEPKITDTDFHEEQITEGNVASCASESVEEGTVKDYQADEKERGSDETSLMVATTEDKEQVETTQIAPEEKYNEGTDVYNTELVGETVEPSFQGQTLEEEATPKLEVEDDNDKSDDLPEKNNKICEEVLDEPKITDRDFNEEQITEGIVTNLTTEPIEEQEMVKDYQGKERETEMSNEEGSSIENIKEGNANDISTECVPEDTGEKLKECIEEAVESKEQIIEGNFVTSTPELIEEDTVKNSQDSEKETIELKEEGTCTESIKEENATELSPEYIQEDGSKKFNDDKEDALKSEEQILEDSQTVGVVESTTCETVNVKRSEDILIALPAKYDEGSSPAPTEASKQENIDEDTSSVQETKDNDGAVTVTETSAEVPSNDEDDSPQVLQKYEPEEELTILRDMQPEEMKPEPSSEIEEVITCTKEETQESLDKEKDAKESDTSTGEACIEAAELSTEGEKEEQTTQEVSSSLIGEETTEESPEEEENKEEAHEECKEAIEGDSSFLSKASEKEIEKEIQGEYSSTVRSFDSEVASVERGLTEATEQVETTCIAPEEKDIEGTDVYNTELVEPSFQVQTLEEEVTPKLEVEDETDKSDDLPEKNNKICEEVLDEPKITDRDCNEEQITEANVANLTTEPVQEQETVKDYQAEERETERLNEEGSSIENIKEGNASDISTECVPEDIDEKLKECIEEAAESKKQIIEGNVTSLTPESIEEDTVKNSQDSEKETIELKEEGTCTESIKEENATELSPEYIQEDGSKKFNDDKEDALKSEEQILEDSQTVGVVESTTCETVNVERSEDTLIALPAKYDEGSSPAPTEASKQEDIEEDTSSVQETKDKDGAVTVTETSAEAPSNDEDDSPQVLQKYEPEEELTILRDLPPEEMKPELSSEIEELITCTKEETQESLDKEKDAKESDTSTGEACIEAAELKEEQITQEVSSSLIGEETTGESSKEEEKMEAHEECKEPIEGDSSVLLKAAEKEIEKEIQGEYSSTVRSFDSEVVSDKRDLKEATEQVETPHIAPEEKDIGGKDVYNTELVGETVEPSSQVQTLEEEGETKLEVEEETDKSDDHPEKGDKICEEVRDEPKITDRDFNEEQITRGNVASCASGSVEEETVKDDQGDQKERDGSNEEGSSIENIKEGNASVISTESVPKDIVEERTGEAVESKQEILQESQKDDRDEETFPIKVAEDNDDYNSTVVLSEAGAEVTSIGEESSEVAQILELGEKHAQVEASNLADEIEVRDLEDKVSVAETTEEETKEVELSNLALEKLDSDAPEEETTESSEVVPEFDSKSTDVVAQDEVTADQTLDEEISKEPSTLPSEEKEVKASEDEHAKEAEVPTEEDRGDLLAARTAEETCLPKEEPRELKVSELALERLDAGETEEETKENSEMVSKFDSQSIGVVSELALERLDAGETEEETKENSEMVSNFDSQSIGVVSEDQTQCEGEKEEKTSELVQETLDADAPEEETKDGSAMVPKVDSESIDELVKEDIIADQTLPEGISTEQLQIPSTALLPKEKELEASEHEHETTSVDKNIEKDNLKEVEVPADEDKQELFAATPTETCLQTEEPRDSELALHKLDAGETEDEIKETFETVTKSDSQSVVVACGDEIVVDQTLCEGITDTPLSKERELGASELALEKLDAVNTEEIKESPEIVPKFDSGIIVVSSDEITIDQTLNEEIMKEQIQSPSSTLLPEEKEHETSEPEHETTTQDKSTEQECTKEVEMSADDNMQAPLAARPVEEECLQKEEPSVLGVSEEANETFETVSRSDFPSIAADPKEEITADKTLSEGVTDIRIEISSYTPLHEEKEPKASELDLEKLDADTTEEEIKEGSEVIPQSVSQSSCEVSKDEIIADQLEVPSSALLPDENELKASEHEHETIIDDKTIEDENLKEVEEPTDEASLDILAARSAEETCLRKEEPSGLKVPELAAEKLEADETEEVKQAFETVSKSGSQSINAVSQDDTIADQTLSDVLTDMPLDIPSYTSLPKENEEVKEAATKLALEKLDADAAEEVKKGSEVIPQSDLQSIDVVVKDEIIADQVLHERITKEQLLIQSPTLLPEEKELKEIEHEHKNLEEESAKETEATADEGTRDVFVASSEEKMHLQKEEPRELKVSELSPENVGEGEEEVTATFESTDAVSREETIAEQTLHQNDEQLQIASPTLLPKEKEEATEQKEELEDCKVLELSPKGETEEETKEAFETAPGVSSQSIGELATDEIVDQIPPSSLISEEKGCENITTINNAGEESMNVVETPNDEGRKDTKSAEETSIPIEEPRELNVSGLDPSSQYTERDSSNEVHEEEEIYIDSNEAKKNEASNEEKNLKVATSDSRAEDSSETTIEANQTAKIEVPNEEIKEEKEVAKDSQLISVEVNTRESQQENESRQEKYPEEKNDTFTAPSEYHHEVPEVDKTGSVSEDIEKQVKPDDKSSMDHSQYEAEGRIQETAIHLGLENQGDEINCENRTREVTYPVEKDSSVEVFQGVLGVEETDETTQNTKQLEKESHATDIPSSKDDALNFLQDPKLEDSTPSNDTLVARETKEETSGIETADPTSAQIPLSERLMDESTKERMKVVTHLTEEKEPTVGKELQADKEEEEEHENVEEAKTDEEKEDTEHKRAYQGYDEPVIVEASRDTEVKVSPKKSHNILSGMGSKVKHSISKVKKAIIGKSSNSKTQSEK